MTSPNLLTFTLLVIALCAAPPVRADASPWWGSLRLGPFEVGFRLIETEDTARAIRVRGAATEARLRPLRVYVWYPAERSADHRPMRFGRYATLADGDVWLGLLGFDMGGMSTLILAMRNPEVDALVAMETAILYPDLDIPTASPHHDSDLLRTPWLQVIRRELGAPRGEETPSLFDTAVHSERYLLLVDDMGHADFTSYALIEDRRPVRGYWGPLRGGEKSRYEAVCLYVSRFLLAHLSGDAESRRLLASDPAQVVAGTTMTLEHRPAEPLMPVDSDYLNALLTGDVAGARETARRILAVEPESPLFEEISLLRLGYHLISSWQLAEEATAVLKLSAELHPRSLEATESLAEVYLMTGDDESALPVVRRALELDPDSRRARAMLDYLERERER